MEPRVPLVLSYHYRPCPTGSPRRPRTRARDERRGAVSLHDGRDGRASARAKPSVGRRVHRRSGGSRAHRVAQHCASCHGGELKGGEGKPLAGDAFWTRLARNHGRIPADTGQHRDAVLEDGRLAGSLSPSVRRTSSRTSCSRTGLPAGARELSRASSANACGSSARTDRASCPPRPWPASSAASGPRGANKGVHPGPGRRPRAGDGGCPRSRRHGAALGERQFALKFVLQSLDKPRRPAGGGHGAAHRRGRRRRRQLQRHHQPLAHLQLEVVPSPRRRGAPSSAPLRRYHHSHGDDCPAARCATTSRPSTTSTTTTCTIPTHVPGRVTTRLREVVQRHGPRHPATVAESDGAGGRAGASLSPFHPRPPTASRWRTCMCTIARHRKGIGNVLLVDQIARARALGHRSIVAPIDGGQAASVGIHARHGSRSRWTACGRRLQVRPLARRRPWG